MTLTELRYITAVAQHRHFGRAADACFVSQPTLSVAVRKLEDELGVILFERTKNDVSITPIGAKVVAQALRVLEEAEGVKALAAAEQDQLASPLTLGCIYTVGPYLLPRLIHTLKQDLPQLRLLIKEDFTDALAEQLRQGRIECAVLSLPFKEPGLLTRPLYDETFVAAMPVDHPLAAKAEVTAADLERETLLLLSERNCFRDQVLEVCPACRLPPAADSPDLRHTLEGSSLETIRQMTAAGAGVTVLPASSVPFMGGVADLLTVRPFAPPAPLRTVALAYRRSFPRPRAIAALAEAIRRAPPDGVEVTDF